jgi:alkylhydroperoxidase family enzyme
VKAFGEDSLVKAVLDDYRTAPIGARLRAMLAFLEKLTLRPHELDERDAAALREGSVDEAAAESAIYVAFVFNAMDRLADAFGFRVNDARGLRWVARILLRVGYGAGCVPG